MNKLKTIIRGVAAAFIALTAFASCSDWTDTESVTLKEPDITQQNPELYAKYLESLMGYKNSSHTLVYVWFDNSEKNPISRGQHITDLPDSVDVVAMMHPDNLADWELKDMDLLRKEKGTKIIYSIEFDAIKKAYNAKMEAATEDEPVSEDFISFLTDTLQHSLSIANKYNYDGICLDYDGKSRIHLRPAELKEYTENETAFIQIINDWHRRNSEKILVYEGKPQNLINPSFLENCRSILISGKDATNVSELSFNLLEAIGEGIPQDRYGMVVNAINLKDENKTIGYFADGTLALANLAEWAPAIHNGFSVKAVGVYNVSSDYYNASRTYALTRTLIESVNPSVK